MVRMARLEFASRFANSRNTGCTVRMLAGMGLGENSLTTKLKRVAFGDSWFDHPLPTQYCLAINMIFFL